MVVRFLLGVGENFKQVVTIQTYFRRYDKLAGMSGTAVTEGEEFFKIYSLDVVAIPTNKPVARVDHADVVYRSEEAKLRAVAREILACHCQGQPVLVGTVAIETSEYLSRRLKKRGIPHQVLNAKQHEREAIVIAQAGRPGAITIATNMAGRGVDILLGGNPDGIAREALRQQGVELTEATPRQWQRALAEAEAQCASDKELVLDLGGLHILGTERHESRRIDNQLRGRSGRQGDRGSSRFYLSLEEDLLRIFGADRIHGIMDRQGMNDG